MHSRSAPADLFGSLVSENPTNLYRDEKTLICVAPSSGQIWGSVMVATLVAAAVGFGLVPMTGGLQSAPVVVPGALRSATPLAVKMQASNGPPYAGPRTSPLLDSVKVPQDMKGFTIKELKQLAHELRWETINAVSKTGGHLGSSLGVIELTVALHYVFDTPFDPVIWDVSHQVYPHKILTGRRERMKGLRQAGGISGFAKRSESEYDVFGAGHSTTSISAALGMAVAFDLQGRQRNSIAVIGDGAITGGMAYEAMNNAAYVRNRRCLHLPSSLRTTSTRTWASSCLVLPESASGGNWPRSGCLRGLPLGQWLDTWHTTSAQARLIASARF